MPKFTLDLDSWGQKSTKRTITHDLMTLVYEVMIK